MLPAAAKGAERSAPQQDATDTGIDGEISISLSGVKPSLGDLGGTTGSTGFGLDAQVGYHKSDQLAHLAWSVTGSISNYRDASGNSQISYNLGSELTHAPTKEMEIGLSVNRITHAITLESLDADQNMMQATALWQRGKNQLEIHGGYRWRRYNDGLQSRGSGYQIGLRYRRSFASWHWIALRGDFDRISSSGRLYGFQRKSIALDYSVPVAKNLRALAGFDLRSWRYDGRHVGADPAAPFRQDQLYRISLGLSCGKPKGFFGRVKTSYDIRRSNDLRFQDKGIRFEVNVGYRF